MKIIEEMISLGFTEYEAKAYFYLLKKNNFTASELAKLSNIPRTKIYSVLDSLIDKGSCIEVPGKIKKYKAVSPENAFKHIKEELEKSTKRIDSVAKQLLPIYEHERNNDDPLNYIEIFRDRNSIIQRLKQLERDAKFEILTMSKPPLLINLSDFDHNKPQKNIVYRYLEDISASLNPYNFEYWQNLIENGIQVKLATRLPLKMMIYDRKVILIGLRDHIPGKESFTSMIIENIDLAETLGEIFDIYWMRAISFDKYYEIEMNDHKNKINYVNTNNKFKITKKNLGIIIQ